MGTHPMTVSQFFFLCFIASFLTGAAEFVNVTFMKGKPNGPGMGIVIMGGVACLFAAIMLA